MVVLLVCALAAWRLRSPELDRRLSLRLALLLLVLVAVGMGGKYLHGSPSVSPGNVALLLVMLAVLGAVAGRLLGGRFGGPLLLLVAVIALWAGLTLLPVLTHGYALVVLPLFLVRAIAAILLGGALSLALFEGCRMLDQHPDIEGAPFWCLPWRCSSPGVVPRPRRRSCGERAASPNPYWPRRDRSDAGHGSSRR